MAASDGGIGYAEHSFAVERGLAEVAVRNGSGAFKQPNSANVTAAIDDAVVNTDGSLGLNFTTSAAEAYPISTVSYFLVPTQMDAKKGDNLKAFLAYVLSAEGQGKANGLGYAPLPAKVVTMATAQAAKVNPQAVTTTTQAPTTTTQAPVTTTTAKKIKPAVAPAQTSAPEPALAASGNEFGLQLAVGGLLTVAGLGLLAQARRRRTAQD